MKVAFPLHLSPSSSSSSSSFSSCCSNSSSLFTTFMRCSRSRSSPSSIPSLIRPPPPPPCRHYHHHHPHSILKKNFSIILPFSFTKLGSFSNSTRKHQAKWIQPAFSLTSSLSSSSSWKRSTFFFFNSFNSTNTTLTTTATTQQNHKPIIFMPSSHFSSHSHSNSDSNSITPSTSQASPLPPRSLSPRFLFSLSSVPTSPLCLGIAGLLPFLSTTLCMYLSPTHDDFVTFQMLQITYGASILSFLGAVHWGTAMASDRAPTSSYVFSVAPCLVGVATLCASPSVAVFIQLGALTGVLGVDALAWRARRLPVWYLPLRLWLTLGVGVCMGIGASASSNDIEAKEGERVSKE